MCQHKRLCKLYSHVSAQWHQGNQYMKGIRSPDSWLLSVHSIQQIFRSSLVVSVFISKYFLLQLLQLCGIVIMLSTASQFILLQIMISFVVSSNNDGDFLFNGAFSCFHYSTKHRHDIFQILSVSNLKIVYQIVTLCFPIPCFSTFR